MKISKGFTLIELLVVIAIIGILSSVVLASLTTARTKGQDAAVQQQLSAMRSQAELYYSSTGNNTYGTNGTSCTDAANLFAGANGLATLLGGQVAAATLNRACTTNGSAWAVVVELPSADTSAYCVDSTGASRNITITANTASTGLSGQACI